MLGFQVSGFTIGAFSSRLLGVCRLAVRVQGFPTENLLTKTFMTGFLLSEVSVKSYFFGFCLGFSCYVHRIADSIQTSNVETSQRMQPLNPGHWFGDRGLKDPNTCKKALTM